MKRVERADVGTDRPGGNGKRAMRYLRPLIFMFFRAQLQVIQHLILNE